MTRILRVYLKQLFIVSGIRKVNYTFSILIDVGKKYILLLLG